MNDKYERDIIERKTQKMNGLNVKYDIWQHQNSFKDKNIVMYDCIKINNASVHCLFYEKCIQGRN